MSIEKLELVNIAGSLEHLNEAIIGCLDSGVFHIENASRMMAGAEEGFTSLSESNPYAEPLRRLQGLDLCSNQLCTSGMPLPAEFTLDTLQTEIDRICHTIGEMQEKITKAQTQLSSYQNAAVHIQHLQGSDDDIGRLLQCKHIVFRFGRMPEENIQKLDFYANQNFVFRSYDTAHEYAWGFYFSTPDQIRAIDAIMKALLFERFYIPDFVHGTPEQALADLKIASKEQHEVLDGLLAEQKTIMERESDLLARMYRYVKYHYEVYRLRGQCVVFHDKFYLMGYIPLQEKEAFEKKLKKVPSLLIEFEKPWSNGNVHPPVRMKNSWFARPFSMFVEMYGLPSYDGFNPTELLAITYTLLFGIMFGDLGQGLLLAIFGWIFGKKTKFSLAPILTRIGCSSAFFGLLYGSVFGFEDWLDPLYEAIGISFLPLHAMEHTNLFIYGAVGLGAGIMLLAILINIVVKLRKRAYEDALFGNNGLMGLIFFGALLAALVCTILTDIHLLTAPYVLCFLVLPLLCMFFREPLGAWMGHKSFHVSSIGDFIASNFFECFEFLLGYATNTLSFIRVGGFVFSHAGLMSVVMVLSNMVGTGVSPLVIILGNLFVMCLEGLIVGIQVLRLEFYEIFSRCYDGEGRPFTPISVSFSEFSGTQPEKK